MTTFDRPRREAPKDDSIVYKEIDNDDGMVFEPVEGGETSGRGGHRSENVPKADRVAEMVREILGAEKKVEKAKREADGGRDGERALFVAEVLLAKARFDQAAYNEKQGKSKKGEADRLLTEWQDTQDRLDAFNKQSIDAAYADAISIAGRSSSELDPDTIAQLRRHDN